MTTNERQEELVETGWKPFGPGPSCVFLHFFVLASQKQTALVLICKKNKTIAASDPNKNFHKAKSNIRQLAHDTSGQLPEIHG